MTRIPPDHLAVPHGRQLRQMRDLRARFAGSTTALNRTPPPLRAVPAPVGRRGSTLLVASVLLALVALTALALAARSAAAWRALGDQRLRVGTRLLTEVTADRMAGIACADTAGVEPPGAVPGVRGVTASLWWRGRRLPSGGCWWVVQAEVRGAGGQRVAGRRTVRWVR